MTAIVDFLDRSPAVNNIEAKFVDLSNDIEFSYQEMINISCAMGLVLQEMGVKPGQVIATYSNNSLAAYCCIFAISRAGAVWLPLNVKNTVDANLRLVEKSDATYVFVEEKLLSLESGKFQRSMAEKILPITPYQALNEELSFFASKKTVFENNIDEQPDRLNKLSLFPTGGTTGDSKLCEWSELTWQTMVTTQSQLMPVKEQAGSYLIITPMSHASGVASFAPIYQGCSILIMENLDVENVLKTIEVHRVTQLFLPPTAIYMLLSHPKVKDFDYSSLTYFLYAAAPMSVEKLKEAINVFGPVMIQSFGQAEAPMYCTCLSVEDHMTALETNNFARLRSCGKPPAGIDVAILDGEGMELPKGEAGEISVKGHLTMSRYYENPEETNAIRVNGWQRTGDIGIQDEQGYVTIVDRKRDMIISGGFNVFPSEIEQILWGHPSVQDCAVIGVPDDKWGEKVTAIIELKQGMVQPLEEEIIQFCKNKLGSVKSPKTVVFTASLPRSPVGKVLKKEIRKEYWKDSDRNI